MMAPNFQLTGFPSCALPSHSCQLSCFDLSLSTWCFIAQPSHTSQGKNHHQNYFYFFLHCMYQIVAFFGRLFSAELPATFPLVPQKCLIRIWCYSLKKTSLPLFLTGLASFPHYHGAELMNKDILKRVSPKPQPCRMGCLGNCQ